MTRRLTPLLLLSSALALAGCAGHAAHHHHQDGPAAPPARVVELPTAAGATQPRQSRMLLDQPGLRLGGIVLKGGTVLPEHHAGVPVTILALQGAGTVVAGPERLRLDATHAVVLAAGVPHAVEPDPGTDLVLLVHHLGSGEDHHP